LFGGKEMKRFIVFVRMCVTVAATVVCIGCATAKRQDLTYNLIQSDMADEQELALCQFYVSKDIILTRYNTDRKSIAVKNGIPNIENTTSRVNIKINGLAKGVLYTQSANADFLRKILSAAGREMIVIGVVFGQNDDEYLEFAAFTDEPDSRFELLTNTKQQVTTFGENIEYDVTYNGTGLPHLIYKIKEKPKTVTSTLNIRAGREVGK
jgi:hypothetical protein